MSPNPTVVFPEPKEIVVEDRTVPEPGPEQVLVETDSTLISTGTELTLLAGEYPSNSVWDDYGEYPVVPGYCNVGTVVEVGDEADPELVDTRVATWNAHAKYTVADPDECRPVPSEVPDTVAATFAIAEIVMNGVRRGRVDWGEAVGVYGLGLLGQLATRFCTVAGASPVIGVDIADDRLDYLPEHPAVVGVNPSESDWLETVEEATRGRLADVVFEVTGNPDVIPGEFDVVREQGRLVLLSSPHGKTEFDFHDHCNAPSYEIIGAHQTSHPPVETPQNPWTKKRHSELYFDLVTDGRIAVEELISHRESYDDAPDLYEELLADRSQAMGVVLEW